MTLRPPLAKDADAVVEYYRDREVGRWETLPKPYLRAHADLWLSMAESGWATGERYQFAVETEGRMIGELNLRPQGAGLALVGFGLAAGYRGRGLITRALRLALPWGFTQAGIDIVHWRAQVDNWASRRVAWAVGFRVDNVIAGLLEHDGTRVDGWLATLRRGARLEPAHAWYVPETITGTSVVLRAHREQDVPRIVEACRDPQTRHWLVGLPADYSPEHARQYLRQTCTAAASGAGVYWAVADPEDDRLLADLGLFLRNPQDPQGEIGYWTHPDSRGRGAATEGVRLAARHALLPVQDGGLGLDRVLIRADADNLGSQRVAERAGFTPAGRDRRANLLRDGSRGDHLRFDLLANELPEVR